MKDIAEQIRRIASIYILLYAAMSFAAWEINPGQWQTTDRGFVAFTGLIAAVFILTMRGR